MSQTDYRYPEAGIVLRGSCVGEPEGARLQEMDANGEAPGNADFIGLEIPAADFVKSFAGETELLQLAWPEMPTDLEESYEAMWPGNIGDLGVIGLVSALNAVGAVTFNSCQGGDGHCIDVPMVAFWAEPSVLDTVCPAVSRLGLRLEPVAETAAEDEWWGKGGEGIFVLGESLGDLRKMRELALSLVRDFATRKQRELLGELESLEEQAGNATLHYGRQLGPFWKDAE